MKRILSLTLTLALIFTAAVPSFAAAGSWKKGDSFYFGEYPQSLVIDKALAAALEKQPLQWTSYGYFDAITVWENPYDEFEDYDMLYADLSYEGERYRAVTFTNYRSHTADYYARFPEVSSRQEDNGYHKNTVYFFKYEPLEWVVLDASKGLVMSKMILDAQHYALASYADGARIYGDETKTYYANDYGKSDLAYWLDHTFLQTAFSVDEQADIRLTTLDNSVPNAPAYSSPSSQNRVFPLSVTDIENKNLGFVTYADRCAQGTAYAKAQGLSVDTYVNNYGNSSWFLRTGRYNDTGVVSCVDSGGVIVSESLKSTYVGVRPAMRIDLQSTSIIDPNAPQTGRVPGDVDADGAVTASDARLALRCAVGLEKYARGSDAYIACDADRDGTVTAADARLILRAAVGLEVLN